MATRYQRWVKIQKMRTHDGTLPYGRRDFERYEKRESRRDEDYSGAVQELHCSVEIQEAQTSPSKAVDDLKKGELRFFLVVVGEKIRRT